MDFFHMYLQWVLPYYAQPITREQLGKLPAGPQSDTFRPPPPNSKVLPDPWWYR